MGRCGCCSTRSSNRISVVVAWLRGGLEGTSSSGNSNSSQVSDDEARIAG